MEAVAVEKLTYWVFRNLEFDDNDPFQYELLDGELVAKSAPSPFHQRLSGKLYLVLQQHVIGKQLGEVFYAPVDVFLNEYNAPQPDLVFVSAAKQHLITNDGIMGVPDLVIEIVSPSSVRRDRYQKREIYERFGITEYWIAEWDTQSVEVYTINETGRYVLTGVASAQGSTKPETFLVKFAVLPDLSLDI
jgi:Uma2 family endonuclease